MIKTYLSCNNFGRMLYHMLETYTRANAKCKKHFKLSKEY